MVYAANRNALPIVAYERFDRISAHRLARPVMASAFRSSMPGHAYCHKSSPHATQGHPTPLVLPPVCAESPAHAIRRNACDAAHLTTIGEKYSELHGVRSPTVSERTILGQRTFNIRTSERNDRCVEASPKVPSDRRAVIKSRYRTRPSCRCRRICIPFVARRATAGAALADTQDATLDSERRALQGTQRHRAQQFNSQVAQVRCCKA
jgi:hypothetical protein